MTGSRHHHDNHAIIRINNSTSYDECDDPAAASALLLSSAVSPAVGGVTRNSEQRAAGLGVPAGGNFTGGIASAPAGPFCGMAQRKTAVWWGVSLTDTSMNRTPRLRSPSPLSPNRRSSRIHSSAAISSAVEWAMGSRAQSSPGTLKYVPSWHHISTCSHSTQRGGR